MDSLQHITPDEAAHGLLGTWHGDVKIQYVLDRAPYTRYWWDGARLVAAITAADLTAQVNTQVQGLLGEPPGGPGQPVSTGTLLRATAEPTGQAAATFSAANAPTTITPKKWLKVRVGGKDGWIPWFSN